MRTFSSLRASPYATKQVRKGHRKVWWHCALTRDRIHLMHMGEGSDSGRQGDSSFHRETRCVPQDLKKTSPGEIKARSICADRGPGFCWPTGIASEYEGALRKFGFRTWAGDDARGHPAGMPDVLLHARAAARVKAWMAKHPVGKPSNYDDMGEELNTWLNECAKFINATYNVKSVCLSFPHRVRLLKASKGERHNGVKRRAQLSQLLASFSLADQVMVTRDVLSNADLSKGLSLKHNLNGDGWRCATIWKICRSASRGPPTMRCAGVLGEGVRNGRIVVLQYAAPL